MRIWSWTVDDWNAAFQILPIVFVALTVLTGAGKFWTDRIIKERHAQELAAAKERTARLETDLAKQQEETAKAKKDLSEVREKFNRRDLTPTDREKLVALLRVYLTLATEAKVKRGELFMIIHPKADSDATEFANLLYHLFLNAGWSASIEELTYPEHTTGISIVVGDSKNLPLYAQVLKNVFQEMNIPASVREQTEVDDKSTFLEIGSRY